MVVYMGVDPGSKGALVVIHHYESIDESKFDVIDFDKVDMDTVATLVEFAPSVGRVYAMMELVTGSVGENDSGRATRMFQFGREYGRIEGIFVGRVKLDLVAPTTWQKGLGIKPIKGETYSQRKRRYKLEAQKLFPNVKVTLAIADALLIAYYCKQLKSGALA
jgi:hypothetical protein